MRDRFASPLSYYYRIFWKRNPRRITSPSRNPIATSNGPALRVNLLIRSSGIMGRVTRREAFNSGSDSCFRSDRENRMNRRNFMQNAVAGALAGPTASSQAAPPASKMIGLQVGAVSFVDEGVNRSEEHTSELQSRQYLVCRLLLEKQEDKKIPKYRQRRSAGSLHTRAGNHLS